MNSEPPPPTTEDPTVPDEAPTTPEEHPEIRALREATRLHSEARAAALEQRVRESHRRLVLHGIGLFGVLEVLLQPRGWISAAVALAFGAALGELWFRAGQGRFRAASLGAGIYLVFQFTGGYTDGYSQMFGLGAVTLLSLVLGVDRELRRTDTMHDI